MLQSRSFGRLGKWMLAALLCLTLSCLITTGAQAAGNIKDTLYEYTEHADHLLQVMTPERQKLDYTSSYAYNMKSNCKIDTVKVFGSPKPYGGAHNCTYGTPKSLPIGAAYYFPNLVKENGYNYATLQLNFNKIKAYLYIWWSPDSV